MPSSCKNLLGALALSTVPAWSARHHSMEGAPGVVQTISALLQQREMGSQHLHAKLAEYAAVTPGAGDKFATSLQTVVDKIAAELEPSIKDAQAATQGEVDKLFQALSDADAAATGAKNQAKKDDESWFTQTAEEKNLKLAVESAEKSVEDTKLNEATACDAQQKDRPFGFEAAGKYPTKFSCDFGTADCDAALATFEKSVLDQIEADAAASLKAERANYEQLKATCEGHTQSRVEAESALETAKGNFNTKKAQNSKLAAVRQRSLCAFGTSAQAKCTAESAFNTFVTSTTAVNGDLHSEADRENEWKTLQVIKCVLAEAKSKGLGATIGAADVETCASDAKGLPQALNTKKTEQGALLKSNMCRAASITFFNGETWNVVGPAASDYTVVGFTPELDPTAGSFEFCSA